MPDNAEIIILISLFVPIVVSLINGLRFKDEIKAGIGFVFCLITAGVTAYFNGDLTDPGSLLVTFALVYGTAMTMYARFWKPIGIVQWIELHLFPGGVVPVPEAFKISLTRWMALHQAETGALPTKEEKAVAKGA